LPHDEGTDGISSWYGGGLGRRARTGGAANRPLDKGAVRDRLDVWRGDDFEVLRCVGLGKTRPRDAARGLRRRGQAAQARTARRAGAF
jgi:Zn ribbon nucleic-acid-binding protein